MYFSQKATDGDIDSVIHVSSISTTTQKAGMFQLSEVNRDWERTYIISK